MKLVVFGAGYVGLVTGTGMAELGHDVLCVDIDSVRVRQLCDGVVPIYEPGLGELIARNVRAGRLQFAGCVLPDFDEADAYFIAVGTPPREDGSADIRAVLSVGEAIAKVARRASLVVVKSTVPVGTCDKLQARIVERTSLQLEVVSNPEFLKEGAALQDFFHPDRIVLGSRGKEAFEIMRRLYAPLQLAGENVIEMDPRSSELVKYASNTMLAMRISFMNELSRLCHKMGANIRDVRLGVGSDMRIGPRFLYAGPGFGGSCFPKDVSALVQLGRVEGVEMKLARVTLEANEEQAAFLAGLVEEAAGDLSGKTVAFLGLAFKPETDDVRDAPSLKLARVLIAKGATIAGHDPEASVNFFAAMGRVPSVRVWAGEYDALQGADVLVLLTEWRNYLAPDFVEVKRRMRGDVVVDARNVWKSEDVKKAGLRYVGVGVR